MISKEQFEAHVRAEAQQKYPHLNIAADRLKRPGTAAISDAVALDRRDTYIAARMEHEWPLVEALQRYKPLTSNCHKRIEADGELNHGPTCRSTVHNERTPRDKWCRVCNATDILAPYTKPDTQTT